MDTMYQASALSVERTKPSASSVSRPWKTAARPGRKHRDYADSDDSSLALSCLEGDELAWEKLLMRYGPLVYSIARRTGLSSADADDVAQNVFTIVFRRLNSLKNHQCLAAWLITITRRECMHYSQRTPSHLDLVEEITDGGDHPSDGVERQQRQLLVHEALSLLDPNSQALLSAIFLEWPTPSYETIARRLGMAVGSIGPARARCLKKLENLLRTMDADVVNALATD